MKILSAEQLKAADQATIENEPIASIDLMERAAYQCFHWISERKEAEYLIHIFCGMGNNGGDGLAIARMLHEEDFDVKAYIIHYSDTYSDDFVTNYQRAEEVDLHPESIYSIDDFPDIAEEDLIIDAIFGTGINRPIQGITKDIILKINQLNSTVYAIDMPSGLYVDQPVNPENAIIRSDVCLTFHSPKLAFLLPDNKAYVKAFIVFNIGLDPAFINTLNTPHYLITNRIVHDFYKTRNRFSHKGDFGHVLIIGGSFGKIGATVLASKAALKSGAGLVTAYIPKCGYNIMQTALPEAMVEVDSENIIEHINYKTKATVIGIGIGMGTHEKTQKAFEEFLRNNSLPLVLDADALNLLAMQPSLLELLPPNSILTPHPKELERLVGAWENDYEKLALAQKFSKKNQCILVIKGAYTAIVDSDTIYFNPSGNPSLATAGTGDVLTGLISGLLAQQYKALEAAIAGVYLHGLTADIAIDFESMENFIASDIFRYIPEAFGFLSKKNPLEDIMDEDDDIDDDFDDYFFDDDEAGF